MNKLEHGTWQVWCGSGGFQSWEDGQELPVKRKPQSYLEQGEMFKSFLPSMRGIQNNGKLLYGHNVLAVAISNNDLL